MNEQGDEGRAQALAILKQPPFTLKKLIDVLGEPAERGQAIVSFNKTPEAIAEAARRADLQGTALYQARWGCGCVVNFHGLVDNGDLRDVVSFPSPCAEHRELFPEWETGLRF